MAESSRSTDDVLRRGLVGFLVIGFVLFQGVRLAQALSTGEPGTIVPAMVTVAFWGWLTWRLVLLLRPASTAGEDPRYWLVSGIGYLVLLTVAIAVRLWRMAAGDDLGVQSWVGVGIVALITLSTGLGWLGARRRREES